MVELITAFFKTAFNWELKKLASELAAYPEDTSSKSLTWRGYLIYGLFFLLIGGFIPLRELIFPSLAPKYERRDVCEAIITAVESSQTPQLADDVADYCHDKSTRARMGYGVYPRFFDKGEGYFDRPGNYYFGIQDYPRFGFRLIGEPNSFVFIRTDKGDLKFPNGALVYLLVQDPKIEGAGYILVVGEDPELIISTLILEEID